MLKFLQTTFRKPLQRIKTSTASGVTLYELNQSQRAKVKLKIIVHRGKT